MFDLYKNIPKNIYKKHTTYLIWLDASIILFIDNDLMYDSSDVFDSAKEVKTYMERSYLIHGKTYSSIALLTDGKLGKTS